MSSAEVAKAMALGALERWPADVVVSITEICNAAQERAIALLERAILQKQY